MESKLSQEQRGQIRALYAIGVKQRILAQQFGVTQACISKIVDGIPKVRAKRPQRRCVDCGTPLKFKTRCEHCLPAWRRIYNQKRYVEIIKPAMEAS